MKPPSDHTSVVLRATHVTLCVLEKCLSFCQRAVSFCLVDELIEAHKFKCTDFDDFCFRNKYALSSFLKFAGPPRLIASVLCASLQIVLISFCSFSQFFSVLGGCCCRPVICVYCTVCVLVCLQSFGFSCVSTLPALIAQCLGW